MIYCTEMVRCCDPNVVARAMVFGAVLWFSGCASSGKGEGAVGDARAAATTTLRLALPAGLEVEVDGVGQGMTPLRSLKVEVGVRRVAVVTGCGTYTAKVNAVPGKETMVSKGAFEGLGFARLQVEASSWEGEALVASVKLGAWEVPTVEAGMLVDVPACAVRMEVRGARVPDGNVRAIESTLAGFVEQVTLEAGESYVRRVVLAPGPDMVRMPGGTYVSGPPEDQLAAYLKEEERGVMGELLRNVERTVVAFDMDRTEVTAAQFSECFETGGCEKDPAMIVATRISYDEKCNYFRDFDAPAWAPRRAVAEGREEHPVNCWRCGRRSATVRG
ncbi:MAG: SUMF1/EgtB/PvdO family nonheme iron enzyme [Nannocystaceae bacterium]|nr:SUMF1/EgtB/PvdO family nonheme iron enzyme [Nannocystaceae bacterium]